MSKEHDWMRENDYVREEIVCPKTHQTFVVEILYCSRCGKTAKGLTDGPLKKPSSSSIHGRVYYPSYGHWPNEDLKSECNEDDVVIYSVISS